MPSVLSRPSRVTLAREGGPVVVEVEVDGWKVEVTVGAPAADREAVRGVVSQVVREWEGGIRA